jgi:hypothetical protein
LRRGGAVGASRASARAGHRREPGIGASRALTRYILTSSMDRDISFLCGFFFFLFS